MLDDSSRQWFKSKVDSVAESQLDSSLLPLFKAFTQHFIHIHIADNMLAWKVEDMYAALFGLFNLLHSRTDMGPQIRIFNPTVESDGWTSPHTNIYICQTDMPFLVDSARMALNRLGLNIYLFESNPAWVRRDEQGTVLAIVKGAPVGNAADYSKEDFAFLQIDFQGDAQERDNIRQELLSTLADVQCSVSDHKPMLRLVDELIEEMEPCTQVEREDIAFLRWLRDGNFTLLGSAQFEKTGEGVSALMREKGEYRLGLMQQREPLEDSLLSDLSSGFADFYASDATLAFTKSSRKSTVHRAVYSDYIIVKRRNSEGFATGETRLLGLYTSQLYHRSIWDIPLIRQKARWLVEHSRFENGSHDGKAYEALLEGHPRDELIQASREQMLETSIGIWRIVDRRTVRLFIRVDSFEKFVSCIVYLPRETLTTSLRESVELRLRDALDAEPGEFSTQFLSESVLVRLHYVFRISNRKYETIDSVLLEQQIVDLTRDWSSALRDSVLRQWGSTHGPAMVRRWGNAFQPGYQHQFSLAEATLDLQCIVALNETQDLGIRFFNESGSAPDIMRLKLFRYGTALELSDIIPLLENLGFRVLVEHPHEIMPREDTTIWMYDFTLRFTMDIQGALDLDAVREHFQQAFQAVWRGHSANDGFNRLVLGARLDWRSAALLRAYAYYLKQLGSPFGLSFIADVLAKHLELTRNLLALFRFKFDPRLHASSEDGDEQQMAQRTDRVERLAGKIIDGLDEVENRNEDEVIRRYLALLQATLRTNFFQSDESKGETPSLGKSEGEQEYKPYISIKLATRELDFAPRPRPMYEIFVHSPRFEGVHLRGGKIARGGIRWSDRFEDFRTEVLGLVKAQQVKNAVIVPTGAKGGFIAREADPTKGREAWLSEGIACYRMYIQGLLDITDNRQGDKVVHPDSVVVTDGEDPYLVVAADKGTASFSDIANEISEQRHHWLGDAFASGGSNGYDHKGMGITARGAWVAVQRHFRELGVDVQKDSIDVIGIGDMSGDVFGNGLLLSDKLRLVAAFNHMHIFIDPQPDPTASFGERRRLFDLPRSGWADYDETLISQGGGVFLRSAKTITLSQQMQQMLDTNAELIAPDELVNLLLKAKVDLVWNGGVGTYVAATNETAAQVGDRTNDGLRVTGAELRCRVFGEGGNLGMTQLGRIEFCRLGGVCNTDFIDNAAGVDCSDNEVNIKILLHTLEQDGRLLPDERNQLLRDMTDDVAAVVLHSNYRQTLSISLASEGRSKYHHEYSRFMQHLEASGSLDRTLEYLPDDDQLKDLYSKGVAWTRPELSVLISYAKVELKDKLILDGVHEDPYVLAYLQKAFPSQLQALAPLEITRHQLANQIIATRLANDMVNRMGFTYCFRLCDSLGVSAMDVARTFVVVMNLFQLDKLWSDIEAHDSAVDSQRQHELLNKLVELGRRASRWYLRNRRELSPSKEIESTKACFDTLINSALDLHLPEWRGVAEQAASELVADGFSAEIAERTAVIDSFFLFPGMVDIALSTGRDATAVTGLCFALTSRLQVDWLMSSLLAWKSAGRWQDLACESHVDELEHLLRQLTLGLLQQAPEESVQSIEGTWLQQWQPAITRFVDTIENQRSAPLNDLAVVTVVLRELKTLVEISVRS